MPCPVKSDMACLILLWAYLTNHFYMYLITEAVKKSTLGTTEKDFEDTPQERK